MGDINENRFTDEDRARIEARVRQVVDQWNANATAAKHTINADDVLALERIACHAISCSVFDMRDSEMAEVGAIVRRVTGWQT